MNSFRHAVAALSLCLLATGCINIPLGGSAERQKGMQLTTVEPAKGIFEFDEILMIPLNGVVDVGGDGGVLSEPGMLVALKDRLKAAETNPRIKAVLLSIDSPGGGVTASDLIYYEIQRFKHKKNIPVVAMMNGVAASGGFYAAMAADRVYAMPTTVTGSIGVIMECPNVEGLAGKVGFKMNVIKSGALKDMGSPFREMNGADRAIFEGLIQAYYKRFFDVVLNSRKDKGLTEDALKKIADGRVFTPQQAVDAKLIDGIAYPDAIIQATKEFAGLKDANLVSYEYSSHYRGHVYAEGDTPPAQAASQFNMLNIDLGAKLSSGLTPRFMYLWMP